MVPDQGEYQLQPTRGLVRGALAMVLLILLLCLAACGDDADNTPRQPPASGGTLNPAAWQIGPVIDGDNHSEGVPEQPLADPEGFVVPIPPAPGHAGYVTFVHGPLTGKSRIVMQYRVEAAEGVDIQPKCCPALPALITVYFQQAGDDWRTDGKRWWATFRTNQLEPPYGPAEIVAPLQGPWPDNPGGPVTWTSVETFDAITHVNLFEAAKAKAYRVGFTLGGGDGYGHGVNATGPARIVVTKFTVE